MLKQFRPKKLFLLTTLWLFLLLVVFASFAGIFNSSNRHRVEAATSSTINFQARLLSSSGSLVPDGYYNVQFNLYNVSSGGTSQWTETYYDSNGVTAGNDNRVRVVNGYLSVYLGSQNPFPGTINWDQEQWITINIGGTTQTATPTWDGEMSPRLQLTAVPYAFRAAQLAKLTGANTSTLDFATQTGARSILLPDESGTLCIQGSSSCGFATGTSASYIQNGTSTQTNANFNIQSAASGSVGGVIQGASGQTADLLQFKNSGGTILTAFDASGKLVFGPSGSQDTNLYRSTNDTLKTDDSLIVGTNLSVTGTSTLTGNVGIGTSPGSFEGLVVAKTYGSATAAESYSQRITTTYSIADTGTKQGLRLNTNATNTSGTQASLVGLLALNSSNGNGGTTTDSTALWTRNDAATGATIQSAYGLKVVDGTGAGTINNQYGVYINSLTKGGTSNYAIYTNGSTQSFFGGNIDTGGDINIQGGDLTTNQTTFNLLAGATTALNIGPGSTTAVSINLAGGAGATGCTVAGATGNLTCDGAIATNATTGTQGWWTRSGTTLSPVNSGDAITTSGNISTSGSGTITAAGTLTANGQSVVIQPSSSLTAGQTNISQTLTNASSSGGTVIGYNQSFTISNTVSSSTNNGINLTLTDNASSLGNLNTGLNVTLNGSNSTQGDVGISSSVVRGLAIQGITSGSTGTSSGAKCNNISSLGVGVCAGDSASSNSGGGLYAYTSSRGTTNIYDPQGSGVYGINQAGGTAGAFYTGVKGITTTNSAAAYTTMGVFGQAKGGAGASAYGGYFTLDSTSSATLGSALYASNSSIAANILQLQDNTTDVFTVADGGNVTAAADIAINGGDLTTTATTFNLLAGATTALNIGPASTTAVSINLAGGSSDTGCTVAGATGNLTCSGAIATTATTGTQGWWTRSGTTLSPVNSGDAITTTGNISTTGSGTITAAGILNANATGKTAIQIADSGAQNSGITIGGDTNLYRATADWLWTDDHFGATNYIQTNNYYLAQGSNTDKVYLNTTGTTSRKGEIIFQDDGTNTWALGQDIAASGVQEFHIYDSIAGATRLSINNNGQLQLPVTGSNGGILVGGDAQLYRTGTDMFGLGNGDSLRTYSSGGSQFFTIQSAATSVYLDARNSGASDWVLVNKVTTDSQQRYILKTSGEMQWGSGTAVPDIILTRSGAGALNLQPTASNNSTHALRIQDASGNPIFAVDNTVSTGRVGIGDDTPGASLEIRRPDQTTENAIRLSTTSNNDWKIYQPTSSSELRLWNDYVNTDVATFGLDGNVTLQTPSTDNVNAFLVKDSSGGTAFTVDTTRDNIAVGAAATNAKVYAQSGAYTVFRGNATSTNSLVELQNAGNNVLQVSNVGNVTAGGSATGTTKTTEATARTSVTTVTLTSAGFANNDVIRLVRSGTYYYTRIVSGGGTTSLTVSPAVSYDASSTVTKYNVQYLGNDGSTFTGTTRSDNSYFQGYFTGGIVTGTGSTIYSDGNISSSNDIKIQAASGLTLQNTSDSTTAFHIQNAAGTDVLNVDTSNKTITVTGSASSTGSQTFNYTGSSQTFTVPAGVTSINVTLYGAGGGSGGQGNTASTGGQTTGTLAVTPGQVLTIYVGGAGGNGTAAGVGGAGGYNGGGAGGNAYNSSYPGGGGGGGASMIKDGATLKAAAGGGGGGAGWGTGSTAAGGNGGGTTGNTGNSSRPGTGGTQSAGGTGYGSGSSTYCGTPATDGSAGQGGAGGIGAGGPFSGASGSGGGGGGYYGGGGGDCGTATGNGGGGGGSGYSALLTGASMTTGGNSGNGQVSITWAQPVLLVQDASNNTYFTANSTGALVNGNLDADTYSVGGVAGADITCAAGTVLQAATVSKGIVTGGSCASSSYARATKNANQSITTGSWTATLSFNTESDDTDNYHNTVTNNSRLTAPSSGWYNITAQVTFDVNGTGQRGVRIMKNGTTIIGESEVNASTSVYTQFPINTQVFLNSGDYIEVQVSQNSGGNLNVIGVATGGNPDTYFSISRIGAMTNSGMTVGTIDSQTKSSDGAVISSNTLYLQTADASNPGLVSTSTQTFAGAKTFSSLLTGSAGLAVTGAASSINASSNFATNINTGTSTGTISIGNNSGNPAVNIDSGTGTISIGTGAQARTINIGTGGAAQTVTLGSTSSTGSTTVQGGSNGITLSTGGTINVKASGFNIQSSGGTNMWQFGTTHPATLICGQTGNNDCAIQAGSSLTITGGNTAKLQVGSSTTDGNIFYLVLDSYNTAADPSGPTNGGMYYNTATNKFRCYQNTTWRDCLSPWIQITKSADQDVTNSATFANDSDLQFSVTAGVVYSVRFNICYAGNSATGDYKGQFLFPAAIAAKNVIGRYDTTNTSDAATPSTAGVLGGTTTFPSGGLAMGAAAALTDKRIFEGAFTFQPNSSGTMNYQFAQSTATLATSARTCANSFIEYQAL